MKGSMLFMFIIAFVVVIFIFVIVVMSRGGTFGQGVTSSFSAFKDAANGVWNFSIQ